jgi:hypothetical protein
MWTKTNNVKVDQGVAQKYLDEIDNGKTINDDMVDEEMDTGFCLLVNLNSIFSAICSSISYLYKLAGVKRPKQ